MNNPSRDEYVRIFESYARVAAIQLIGADLHLFYDRKYRGDTLASCYHPKYLLDFISSYCEFNDLPKIASLEMLDRAWGGVFTLD